MSQGGLHSLATIIKRLEAATSRLEDLAIAQASSPKRDGLISSVNSGSSVNATSALPLPPPPPPPPPPPVTIAPAAEIPRSVTAFDETVISGKLEPFVSLTKTFSSQILIDQVNWVESAFKNLRSVILAASTCAKGDAEAFQDLMEPIRKDVGAVLEFPEKNRKEIAWFNHLQCVAEGIPSVGWIEIEPKPGPHVAQMKQSAEFYGNRIMKEYKDKDKKHFEWVRAWLAVLEEQRRYVMEFHTTGLQWNSTGIALSEYSVASPAPVAPPPPPPLSASASSTVTSGGFGAVFAELNRGEQITQGLRKVDRSEMSHKNPELRASGTVPAPTLTKRPLKPSKPASLSKRPPKFALEGSKWNIEHQENETSLTVISEGINQSVNLFGCKNTTVVIKGKVNAVTMLKCTKTSILVDSVISSISVTDSPSFALQITGTAPTIQLDSTDSGQIFLSKNGLNAEILTAKCSAINVNLPVEGEEEGVFVERAVPEMLRTTIKDGKLVTTTVEYVA